VSVLFDTLTDLRFQRGKIDRLGQKPLRPGFQRAALRIGISIGRNDGDRNFRRKALILGRSSLSEASQPVKQNGTLFADPIRASSPKSTASTGRTEDCSRPTPIHQISLAIREPSTEDV
jgi:hypothetical protein